ncbi:MAG: DNA-deoxyinosine glycosylase [Agathobacter sp.]|nr:DNA-deoxyinosine glycosylase [Lachnospiraceae bacterium]MDY2621210.1 DNA-deoxyinosine glycosylase [Agathobacter sp.]
MEYEHIVHSFEPVYDKDSEILILGTLPSVKSRENNFYYGHKQNRFWKVLATLLKEPVPETIEEKKAVLLAHRIALWDVIQSCDIKGSSDSSIKNVQPTDIGMILEKTNMTQIYANGNKAGQLYKRYQFPVTGIEATVLPSTSPANAAWSLARLCEAWKTILHDL